MINMFPQLRPRQSTGVTLAMAANPANTQLLGTSEGPTQPWTDQYGYGHPWPWRSPIPPYERGHPGATPLPRPDVSDWGELTPIEKRPEVKVEGGGFPSLLDAIRGLGGEKYAPPAAPTKEHYEQGQKSWDAIKNWLFGEETAAAAEEAGGLAGGYGGSIIGAQRPPGEKGGDGGGGYRLPSSGVTVPTYKPGTTPPPDWGPLPEAPVFQNPDYAAANEYYQAAKPKPYEEDEWDVKLAALAGLASGFSPEGTAGEILGRMAGPGMRAFVEAREVEEAQALEAERALQAWNASMGGVATDQATAMAETANANAEAQYNHALTERDALREQMEYARDEDRYLYEAALGEAELKLQIAAENRDIAYTQWKMENPTSSDDIFGKTGDDVWENLYERNYLPGLDMPAATEAARAEIQAEIDAGGEEPLDWELAIKQRLYRDYMNMLQGG